MVQKTKSISHEFVALLRGVNVGGNRIIKSADLKACFEKMGFREVRVILQSGNVKFASELLKEPQVRTLLEAGLSKQFGYPAKAIVMNVRVSRRCHRRLPLRFEQQRRAALCCVPNRGCGRRIDSSREAKGRDRASQSGEECRLLASAKGDDAQERFWQASSEREIQRAQHRSKPEHVAQDCQGVTNASTPSSTK